MTLLTFPCEFPVKIFGHNVPEFEMAVLPMVHKHFPTLKENALQYKNSKQGNYLSITITVEAESQAQLDALYQDLTECEHVVMSL